MAYAVVICQAIESRATSVTLTLPWFHVHQIVGKFLMNGGRYEQERVGCEPAVHR